SRWVLSVFSKKSLAVCSKDRPKRKNVNHDARERSYTPLPALTRQARLAHTSSSECRRARAEFAHLTGGSSTGHRWNAHLSSETLGSAWRIQQGMPYLATMRNLATSPSAFGKPRMNVTPTDRLSLPLPGSGAMRVCVGVACLLALIAFSPSRLHAEEPVAE